jgi:iron complex transport system ATP-binding protein
MEKTVLNIKNAKVGYPGGMTLLRDLNLEATSSETIALVGANGTGKSTFLRTLIRLIPLLDGNIQVLGDDLYRYSRQQFARIMSFVSTEMPGSLNMNVTELVAAGRYPYTNWFGNLNEKDNHLINKAIEMVDLVHLEYKKISEISDGERQRAMIARALAQDTPMMILDEPTAFLDIPNRFEIIHLLVEMSRKAGKTVVFSTHDLSLALTESDKIWVVVDKNIDQGSPEDLILQGKFDKLFKKDVITFDRDMGEYKLKKGLHGKIKITGDASTHSITSKALQRVGFAAVNDNGGKMVPEVRCLSSREGNAWILHCNKEEKKFLTIYDLVTYLKKLNINP